MSLLLHRLLLALLLIAALPMVPSARADEAQISFAEYQRPEGLAFDYLFRDAPRSGPHHLTFLLPTETVKAGAGSYNVAGHYDPTVVTERVRKAVAAATPSLGDDVEATVTRAARGYQLAVRTKGRPARLARVMAALKRVAADAEAAYLSEVFLRPVRPREVAPDYGRLAGLFVSAMRPVAAALAAAAPNGGERQRLALALAFVQSIPYDTRAAALRENAYVVPPMMLVQNKGACDSKSVTLASLLVTLLPGREMVVILVPEHALLGVALPPLPGDRTLVFDGRTYVLMEPVGPAQTPPGQVSEHSAHDLSRVTGVTMLPVTPPMAP